MDARTAKRRAYGIAADLIAQAIATGGWSESVDAAGAIEVFHDVVDTDRVELGLMEIEDQLRRASAPRSRTRKEHEE